MTNTKLTKLLVFLGFQKTESGWYDYEDVLEGLNLDSNTFDLHQLEFETNYEWQRVALYYFIKSKKFQKLLNSGEIKSPLIVDDTEINFNLFYGYLLKIEKYKPAEKFIHKCDTCNCGTNEFFYANDIYYCSEECLPYTKEEWAELCKHEDEDEDEEFEGDGNDDFYWSEIQDEEDIELEIKEKEYYFDENGHQFFTTERACKTSLCFIPENDIIEEEEIYINKSNLVYLLQKYRNQAIQIQFIAEMLQD